MSAIEQVANGWPPRIQGEWTVDNLRDSPDDGQRYEILDGVLLVTPVPAPRHQWALLELAVLLRGACPSDHAVFVAPLDWQPDPRTSLQPDIIVVRLDRVGEKNVALAPTIVVEIASPSTARIDRMIKLTRYAEGGIAQYWIVDPSGPSIQVFDLVDGEYQPTLRADGSDLLVVPGPIPVSVRPSELVLRR
ncbi:MAG TPA: Uma2 family endonuclease [Microlunatus sp.]